MGYAYQYCENNSRLGTYIAINPLLPKPVFEHTLDFQHTCISQHRAKSQDLHFEKWKLTGKEKNEFVKSTGIKTRDC